MASLNFIKTSGKKNSKSFIVVDMKMIHVGHPERIFHDSLFHIVSSFVVAVNKES